MTDGESNVGYHRITGGRQKREEASKICKIQGRDCKEEIRHCWNDWQKGSKMIDNNMNSWINLPLFTEDTRHWTLHDMYNHSDLKPFLSSGNGIANLEKLAEIDSEMFIMQQNINRLTKTCWKSGFIENHNSHLHIETTGSARVTSCLPRFSYLSLLITQLLYIFFQNRSAVIIYLLF